MVHHLKHLNIGLALSSLKQQRAQHKSASFTQRAFSNYQAEADTLKIQFGCGTNLPKGWFNTDVNPNSESVFVDIKKPLPFANQSFDFAFSEHVFGYLNFEEAKTHLNEVARILKSGGVYQILTPNLDLIFNQDEATTAYYKWYLKKFKVESDQPESVYYLNHFMKIAYGTYFHNAKSLLYLGQQSEFISAEIIDKEKSTSHRVFKNMPHHGHVIGEEFNALETIIVEYTK